MELDTAAGGAAEFRAGAAHAAFSPLLNWSPVFRDATSPGLRMFREVAYSKAY
jgi:hypothetical protein